MLIEVDIATKSLKLADNNHPIHPLLQLRWSPRAFAPRPVERAKLLSLLEAARWSPSGSNKQPWFFHVGVQGDEAFGKLAGCLNPSNAEWAAVAPVLLMSVAQTVNSEGKPMRYAFHDVGMAEMSLIVQAMALDLYVHPMAGFSAERARVAFKIPEDHEPVVMLAIGYLGAPEQLSERRRSQELEPRTRKALREFVFAEQWGEAAAVLGSDE
jgi:nitroreductase